MLSENFYIHDNGNNITSSKFLRNVYFYDTINIDQES